MPPRRLGRYTITTEIQDYDYTRHGTVTYGPHCKVITVSAHPSSMTAGNYATARAYYVDTAKLSDDEINQGGFQKVKNICHVTADLVDLAVWKSPQVGEEPKHYKGLIVYGIFVQKPFRGRGLGRKMFDIVLKVAQDLANERHDTGMYPIIASERTARANTVSPGSSQDEVGKFLQAMNFRRMVDHPHLYTYGSGPGANEKQEKDESAPSVAGEPVGDEGRSLKKRKRG